MPLAPPTTPRAPPMKLSPAERQELLEEYMAGGQIDVGELIHHGVIAPPSSGLPRAAGGVPQLTRVGMSRMPQVSPAASDIPPPEQRAEVIAQIKSMLASEDPDQVATARAYVDKHGRGWLSAFANKATAFMSPSTSDRLMTQSPGEERGQVLGRYTPDEMEFGDRLSRAADPGWIHGAEMAGTATSLASTLLPWAAARAVGAIRPRPGLPPSSPAPEADAAPTGPLGLPPGFLRQRASELPEQPPGPTMPEPLAGEPPAWPKIVEDLRASGRPPVSEKNMSATERAYYRELDKGLPAQSKSKVAVEDAIKPMSMDKLRKLLGIK